MWKKLACMMCRCGDERGSVKSLAPGDLEAQQSGLWFGYGSQSSSHSA